MDLSWMQQGVLFGTIRGCDGRTKEDPSKRVIRGFRDTIIMSAKDEGSFLSMTPTPEELKDAMDRVCEDADHYPVHFITHLMYGAEIVGYKCPLAAVAATWQVFYERLVEGFHFHPETEAEMDARLEDDPKAVKKSLADEQRIVRIVSA